MAMVLELIKVKKTRWVSEVRNFTNGYFPQRCFRKCTAREKERKGWITTLLRSHLKTSAHGSWDVICSGLCADRGQMMNGKVGGAKIRRIMFRYLFYHTMQENPSA